MHGAGGGQAAGSKHPNYKHGLRAKQMEDIRRLASILGKEAHASVWIQEVGSGSATDAKAIRCSPKTSVKSRTRFRRHKLNTECRIRKDSM